MLASGLLLISSLLSVPDLYVAAPGRAVHKYVVLQKGHGTYLAYTDVSATPDKEMLATAPRPMSHARTVRFAVNPQGIWSAGVCDTPLSGISPLGSQVTWIPRDTFQPLARPWLSWLTAPPQFIQRFVEQPLECSHNSAAMESTAASLIKLSQELRPPELAQISHPALQWRSTPYDSVLNAIWGLIHRAQLDGSIPENAVTRSTLSMTIAAISHERCIIGISFAGRILWYEATVHPDTRIYNSFTPSNPGYAMSYNSLGMSETVVEHGATACWIDNALHLIGDGGSYERYEWQNGELVRTSLLESLPTPQAICQGTDRLWLLSRTDEGETIATELSWPTAVKTTQQTRHLGCTSFNRAAIQLLRGSD